MDLGVEAEIKWTAIASQAHSTSRPRVQRFAAAPSDGDPQSHVHEYSKTIKT
jgi:hypothetical protein